MHILCHHRVIHLHPEFASTCDSRATNLNEEKVFGVTTSPDIHELQYYSGCIRVQLNQTDRSVGQAQAVNTNQIFNLPQTFRFHDHLPHFFEGQTRRVDLSINILTINAIMCPIGSAFHIILVVAFTAVVQVHQSLVPSLLLLLTVGSDGEALILGIQSHQMFVLRIRSLVDIEAAFKWNGPLWGPRLMPPLLFILIVLQPG